MNKVLLTTLFYIASGFALYCQDDTTWNKLNLVGEKSGFWRKFHANGKLKYQGQFKNDRPIGVFRYYFNTGELKTILRYRNDSVAFVRHYYSTGDLLAQGRYLNQQKDSIWISYGASEIKLEEGAYLNGKKYGIWKVYFPEGGLAEEKFYENDLEQGEYNAYHANGKLKQNANYKNGFMEGKSSFFNKEGQVIIEGEYIKDVRNGEWVYYDENQKVKKVLKYDKGKLLNPEENEDIDFGGEEYRNNVKDWLEFEDMPGTIIYESNE